MGLVFVSSGFASRLVGQQFVKVSLRRTVTLICGLPEQFDCHICVFGDMRAITVEHPKSMLRHAESRP
jgi:hypothetical protein